MLVGKPTGKRFRCELIYEGKESDARLKQPGSGRSARSVLTLKIEQTGITRGGGGSKSKKIRRAFETSI